MAIILDLALAAVVLYCGWRGFRSGIINGICGILAVIVSIYGGFIVATAYSTEFIGVLKPFATGLVESLEADITAYAQGTAAADAEAPVYPLTAEQVDDDRAMSMALFRQLGFYESVSASIADTVPEEMAQKELNQVDAVTLVLCERVCFVGLFAMAFLLITIVFFVVGNVLDLSFGIPGHENLNHITGALLGLAKGVLVAMLLVCFVRYLGLVLSDKVIDGTIITKKLIEENQLVSLLGF